MADPLRVIVADDHPLFLDGVAGSLSAAGLAVVGRATTAADAVRLAREHRPDMALLDVAMPGGGLRAAREIAAACPATKIVMLTVSEDEDHLLAALQAGAAAYVLKGVSARELVGVLRAAHAGEVYTAPTLAGRLLGQLTRPRPSDPLDELTVRERAVLELVAAGLGNQEIGARLGLAAKTVKHYMTNILAKLQVRSRVEAALVAYKAGLGQSP
jgi:DNA-binding NarL/FixJ family response regulator